MQLDQIFAKDIQRPIEGVIKADDAAHLATEVDEYVLTNEAAKGLEILLEESIWGLHLEQPGHRKAIASALYTRLAVANLHQAYPPSVTAALYEQADALCAYLKCLEELSAGNNEFLLAKTRLEKTLESRRSEEMDYFMQVFVPSFHLSLDEISQDSPL